MIQRLNRRGVTMIELLLVVAIVVIGVGGIIMLVRSNSTFFTQIRVRQAVGMESRACMDRIEQMLRNGKARSLKISTPSGNPVLPNSRIDFQLHKPLASGTNACRIYLQDRTVYLVEYRPAATSPQVLAKNVTGLMFTGDPIDPAIVGVSLQIDSVYNPASKSRGSISLLIPNRKVTMVESP